MRRLTAGIISAGLILGMAPLTASALPDPAPEDLTSRVTLTKVASTDTVGPSETFTYTLRIGCSEIDETVGGCVGAQLSDTVPEPFELVSVNVAGGSNSAADPVIDGNDVTVTFTTALSDGTTGLLPASTAVVTLQARLRADASYDYDNVPVVNTALTEGTNFADVPAEATVTPQLVLDLATTAGKSLDPTSSLAAAGTPVVATINGSNESNATVDTLVLQDPVDPTATPNPLTYLGFGSFGAVTEPEGTTATTYQLYVEDQWIDAPGASPPAGVDPAECAAPASSSPEPSRQEQPPPPH